MADQTALMLNNTYHQFIKCQLAPPHRSNINSGAHWKIREVVVRLPSQRLVKRPVNLLVSLELDDKGSSTEEISKKLKSEEQTSTEPSHQRDQSDRDTPVLRTAQQPNNLYDLRPRQKINYTKKKEDTEPIARINKIMEASTLLQVSLMLSLGVTILASKSEVIKETIRSIQCVPGGVHLISPDRIPYEVCAENYCVQFDNPCVDENISFLPDIIFRYLCIRCIIEHLVQWKFGEKLNTIETLCHPSSLCQAITCSFCSANTFNPERWPISAILGTAILLYFLITGCYVLLYVPLVIGKPIRMVAHILFGFCSTTAGSDDVKLPTEVDRDSTAEIIAISLIAIIPAAKQCQLINIFTDRSTICTNNGFGPCQIELSEVFKINPFKREACLKITRNDTSIHEVRLQWKSLLLNCEPETDMFTRDTVHKVVDSKRCPHSGSCTGDKCASINSSSIIPELAEGNQYPGNTACVESCGGPGCDCFFPSSGCLFHRNYLQPINNKTFEILHCNRWAEAAKVEITHIDGIQRKVFHLHYGKHTAVWKTNAIPALRCFIRDNAQTLSCEVFEGCVCMPAETKVNCKCKDFPIGQWFNNVENQLPAIFPLHRSDSTLPQKYRHAVSTW
ncbi:hypothetical protein NECAME_10671 [Necator americanus]|uniref:Phlebovirus glycoprotein G2 fusion domain-containing protein n=1 Tax=Necator americanus TaxID=51031 RepID=W2T7H2_NECAM|nr:hypothetical protein NECAME_10671 [Necator americanus]ETN77970.1 hypothetical protein NECAME_10671 [Necator americanus]